MSVVHGAIYHVLYLYTYTEQVSHYQDSMPLGLYFALARRSAPLLRGQSVLVCRAMSTPAVKKIQGESLPGDIVGVEGRRGVRGGAVLLLLCSLV